MSLYHYYQRVDLSLKKSFPWLVLAGSGGLADFLSDLLENLSSAPVAQSSSEGDSEAGPSVDLIDRVAERIKKHFPSEANTDKLVERVRAKTIFYTKTPAQVHIFTIAVLCV